PKRYGMNSTPRHPVVDRVSKQKTWSLTRSYGKSSAGLFLFNSAPTLRHASRFCNFSYMCHYAVGASAVLTPHHRLGYFDQRMSRTRKTLTAGWGLYSVAHQEARLGLE